MTKMKDYLQLDSTGIRELEEKYLFPTYKRYEVFLSHGSGARVYDLDGRGYLDFLAGIAVNSLGYSHPRITRVYLEQAARLIHCSNLFYNPYQGALARRLAEISGLSRAFFTNSGTEANEAALKIARAHGRQQGYKDKTKVLAVRGAFHGRTFGSLSLTFQEKYQAPFRPLVADIEIVEATTVEALEKAFDERTCALFLEPIQGESGVIPLPGDFFRAARELCTQFNALLVLDEIQCGLGRTGKYFAFQHYGVEPDLLTLAKPLAGGYPLGAVLGNARVAAALKAGEHGTTFGGGPLACRLALEFLDTLEEEKLLERVAEVGGYLMDSLRAIAPRHRSIGQVRGMGLMVGVELGAAAVKTVKKLLRRGVIANAAHETVLRLLPPLIISRADVNEFVSALDGALSEVEAEGASSA